MITKRLLQVQILLLAGMASVFLLPRVMKSSPAGIALNLPEAVGEWIGHDAEVTAREREILAKDTGFARKTYSNLAGNQIFVSIVLSGDDMTNSIHRPERCMPAQGWNITGSQNRVIALGDGKSLETTKLRNVWAGDQKAGFPGSLTNLTYYWFVGYNDITASHITRTGMDLRDRVLRGYGQRWAYVTVSISVSEGLLGGAKDEKQGATVAEKFIAELIPVLKRPEGTPIL